MNWECEKIYEVEAIVKNAAVDYQVASYNKSCYYSHNYFRVFCLLGSHPRPRPRHQSESIEKTEPCSKKNGNENKLRMRRLNEVEAIVNAAVD